MPQAWEAFSEGKCIDRILISSEQAYSKSAALKCHWFPGQEKNETKPEWMTKKTPKHGTSNSGFLLQKNDSAPRS